MSLLIVKTNMFLKPQQVYLDSENNIKAKLFETGDFWRIWRFLLVTHHNTNLTIQYIKTSKTVMYCKEYNIELLVHSTTSIR